MPLRFSNATASTVGSGSKLKVEKAEVEVASTPALNGSTCTVTFFRFPISRIADS